MQLFPEVNSRTGLVKAVAGVLGVFVDERLSADCRCFELTIKGGCFAPIVKALNGDMSWAPDIPLGLVTQAYIALLDAWDKARAAGSLQDDTRPVLVVDEANVLMEWGEQYKAEMQTLLNFFVAVAKERRHLHVILATSDSSFLDWLSKGAAAARHGAMSE
jgi:hypothetical protein